MAHCVDERGDDAPTTELRYVAIPPAKTFGALASQFRALLRERIAGVRNGIDRGTVVHAVRQGVAVVGIMLIALAEFESFVGGITESRDQRALHGRFQEILSAQAAFAAVIKRGQIPPGTPVVSIDVPKIGLRKIVIEGTTSNDLRQAPGHLRATPLPGQHGNAVIAGRRTTYGAPFRHLGDLVRGDIIKTTTPFGTFRYRVREIARISSGQPDRLGATMRDILTLTTSDPPYRADRRLVLIAHLASKRSVYADPPRPLKVDVVEASFFGNAAAAIPAACYEVLLLVSLVLARSLYRRWHRWPTYLITTPLILALAFAWLQAMVSLLPSTL